MRLLFILTCLMLCVYSLAADIVPNGSFEIGGRTTVSGWSNHVANGDYEFTVEGDAHSGNRCLAITRTSEKDGWARWFTTDLFLIKGAVYHVRAWIKTANGGVSQVHIPLGAGQFDNYSRSLQDIPQWTMVEGDFTAMQTGAHGVYLQNLGPGTVYYDDVSIELVNAPVAAPGEPVPTDGNPLAAVIIPDNAQPHHIHLALELQRILKAITGAELSIRMVSNVTADDKSRNIWVGIIPSGRNYKAQLAEAGEEGIVLDIDEDAIVCLGNSPRSEYYAVMEFLYKLGCRWAWPGKDGEALPKADKLELTPCLLVHRPSYDLRGAHFIQAFHTPPDWSAKHCEPQQWIDWAARNYMNRLKPSYSTTFDYGTIRGGGVDEIAGHSLYYLLPPEKWFATNPEFYPLVKGERTHLHSSGRAAEICVSDPEIVKVFADALCDFFAAHPSAKRACINAEDEPSYWCECDACKALDPIPQDWSKNGEGSMFLTDRWLHFINAVAEQVEKKFPDKYVSTFAYGSSRELPVREVPRRNVMIEFTWWEQCFKHPMEGDSCEVNAAGMQLFREWSRLAPVALYRYLDYHHMESPCAMYHSEADILRAAHAGGCRYLSDEWDTTFNASPLLLNLRARLEWDVNTDVDAYINQWCQLVYGKAAPEVERYFLRLEQGIYGAAKEHVSFTDQERLSPDVLRDCHQFLDYALAKEDDPVIVSRIDRLRVALWYAELCQLEIIVGTQPEVYPRLTWLQKGIWEMVQKHQLEPVVGYFGKLGLDYQPPIDALTARKVMQLPLQWQFRQDAENIGETQGWQSATPGTDWVAMSIEKVWEEQGYPNYDGFGWYTVEVDIPQIPEPRVWLLCEAVDENWTLWINGEFVGKSENEPGLIWDKPVALEITDKFKPGQRNRITMRVHDSAHAGGIWKPVWIVAKD